MSEIQRFRYAKAAIYKDYAQAAAGVLIFGLPIVLSGGNVYVLAILGAIMLMFAGFGWHTWRRHRSVIAVTEEGVWSEGAIDAAISWRGVERVDLRYFAMRRSGRNRRQAPLPHRRTWPAASPVA